MNAAIAAFIARRMWISCRDMAWSHLLIAAMTAITLFIFSAFLLLQENLQGLLKAWGDQIQINAYLEKNLAAEQIHWLLARMRELPEVERVRYISQQQAWRDFEEALGAQAGVLQGLPPDVLPASFEIWLKPQFREPERANTFVDRVKGEEGIAAVEYARDWFDRLSVVVRAAQWAKWVLGGLLLLATFFIVDSAIKLALVSRREEVEIMQLVGASQALIQAPFVLEGMIRGIFGATIALAALWALFRFFGYELSAVITVLGAAGRIEFLAVPTMLQILVLGWFLGAAASLFSVRRFLRTWKG
jgi:cell division transport system permease protein